jgi:hypothetical protein
MTVAYAEELGSPTETRTNNGIEATRILRCDWSDRYDLEAEILAAGGEQYPFRSATGLRARSIAIRPANGEILDASGDPTMASYQQALLTVAYRTPTTGDAEEVGDALISESLEPWTEFYTLDWSKFRWGATDGPPIKENEAPGRLVRGVDYIFTRHESATIPAAAFSLIGKVNVASVTATLLGVTFGAQTLLYKPPTLQRSITTDGAEAWKIIYRFSYRPEGWNRFWRPETATFVQLYTASGAYDNYLTGDFTVL